MVGGFIERTAAFSAWAKHVLTKTNFPLPRDNCAQMHGFCHLKFIFYFVLFILIEIYAKNIGELTHFKFVLASNSRTIDR